MPLIRFSLKYENIHKILSGKTTWNLSNICRMCFDYLWRFFRYIFRLRCFFHFSLNWLLNIILYNSTSSAVCLFHSLFSGVSLHWKIQTFKKSVRKEQKKNFFFVIFFKSPINFSQIGSSYRLKDSAHVTIWVKRNAYRIRS